MSRVYRFDDFQHLQSPTPEAFASELGNIRSELQDLHAGGHIEGAFIWGSAAHGEASPRSDFDLIIATPDISLDSLRPIQKMTDGVYKRSGIPTDATTYASSSLRDGSHGYFRENALVWLRRLSNYAPQNIIGKNPVDMITPVSTDLIQDMDRTFSGDREKLQKDYLKGGAHPNKEGALEHVLDLPHHVGRRCISTLIVSGYMDNDILPSPKRSHVTAALQETFGNIDPEITSLSSEINGDATLYTKFVETVMSGSVSVSRDEYDHIVTQTLRVNLPKAIVLVDKVHDVFKQYAGLK
jgi:hypothetical protein